MIQMNSITKTYQMGTQSVHALCGVDLHVAQGEFIAIMGPSGSGKSTLMNIIGCLDIPSGGRYILDGLDVSQMNDNDLARTRNKKIGFVFQQFNLLPRTSAVKQVSLPLMYAGIGRNERRQQAEAALTAVGLGERLHHRPDELSGGQQQRVAIARALATKPSIILADEPTGALDTQSGADIMRIFHDMHTQGITLVVITHDPDVAAQAGRTVHIRDGLIMD